jgi:DNA-binding IclR family transcriptional regulator
MARNTRIPAETLLGLRSRLTSLPARAPARREEVRRIAELFGVSSATVYRSLQELHRPKDLRRARSDKTR